MMFSRLFNWSMRNGAPILFAMSLLIFVLAVGPYLYLLLSESRRMSSDLSYHPAMNIELTSMLTALFTAINSATFPFLGAVLITVANKFLEKQDA